MRNFPFIEILPARKCTVYGKFTPFYAKKDGGLFLKEEKKTLWDINGFLLQTKKHRIILVFKRSRLSRAVRQSSTK